MSNIIHVLGKRIELEQHEGGFQTSIDAVLLAAACPAKSGDHILDLGCGVGSAGLCVLRRVEGTQLTGIDIQDDVLRLAKENAKRNDMGDRADFIQTDVKTFERLAFDHVICNPPYLSAGDFNTPPSPSKATAVSAELGETTLKDWVTCAFQCLKGQGSLTIIHRADQTDAIIHAMGKRFGAVEIIPLWPKSGVDAKRVIIRAHKHRKSAASFYAGITIHDEEGAYTAEAENILRGMAAID